MALDGYAYFANVKKSKGNIPFKLYDIEHFIM